MSDQPVELAATLETADPAPARRPLRTATSEQPLLLLFLLPVLVLVGVVVLIGSSTTWVWVGVVIACIAFMTFLVLAVIARLVDDGGGPSH